MIQKKDKLGTGTWFARWNGSPTSTLANTARWKDKNAMLDDLDEDMRHRADSPMPDYYVFEEWVKIGRRIDCVETRRLVRTT